MKVITDEKIIDNVLSRGVENIYPNADSLKELLMSGKRLRIYCGFDPTAATLHLGHGIQIRKLAQFLDLGHEVIFLYGGFTAMIGDPTDKAQARKALTADEVKQNMKGWKDQIKNLIDIKKLIFKNNNDWLSKLKFADVIELTTLFTAQQMLARDMFKKRLEEGKDLYINEFMYPLMQAYDSYAMDVDLEIGGNDQMFNMLAGRTLMKKMKNKEKMVLTTSLLEDPTGKKMGKSEGNMITLVDSAEDIFGKVMSWTDEMIIPGFEILTGVSLEDIENIQQEMKAGGNPRDYKVKLAYEVVKVYQGETQAKKAEENFRRVFQEKQKPSEIKRKLIGCEEDEITVLELFVKSGLANSKSEVRRLIAEKAIKINDEVINDPEFKVKVESIYSEENDLLLQRGKKQFIKIGIDRLYKS